MKLKNFKIGFLQTNSYLIYKDDGLSAILIDAPGGIWDELSDEIASHKLNLLGVLITHGHWDHVGDIAKFSQANIPIYAHDGDSRLFNNPMIASDYMPPGMSIDKIKIDHSVQDGEILKLIDLDIYVLHTPGHTPGCVSYYIPNMNSVFVGDLIFKNGVGRTDFPGGSWNLLQQSIKEKIYTLPQGTVVYSGHGENFIL